MQQEDRFQHKKKIEFYTYYASPNIISGEYSFLNIK